MDNQKKASPGKDDVKARGSPSGHPTPRHGPSAGKKAAAAIGIVVIAIIVAGALAFGLNRSPPTSISTFLSNFYSAPRVAIYTTAYNGTQISSTIGCASALIESVVGSPSHHRNASTIDFFAINGTSCTYELGIGGIIKNYTYNSISNCINMSRSEPSIFINYSESNSTIVKPESLYIYGNQKFLAMCGITTEIS
jgi:hypothetical protein